MEAHGEGEEGGHEHVRCEEDTHSTIPDAEEEHRSVRKEGLDGGEAAAAEDEEVHGGDGDGEKEDAEEDIHGHHDTHTSFRDHSHRDDKVDDEAEDEAPCSRTFARHFPHHVGEAEEAPCSWEGHGEAQNVLDTATLSLKSDCERKVKQSLGWKSLVFQLLFLNCQSVDNGMFRNSEKRRLA